MELIPQVLAVESTIQVLVQEPIFSFAILLVVILFVPIAFERLQLPGLVGLVLSGVVLGPSGWNIFNQESSTLEVLANIGLVYLMFVAGLEVDLEQFHRKRCRTVGFSGLTFSVPMIVGILLGRSLGFGWNAAILIGSILASHTLLAYPLINRLGVINNEAVGITVGSTILTDLGALLVLAVSLAVNVKHMEFGGTIPLVNSLIVYIIIVLFGFNWAGKEFFRRSGDDESNQFLFLLLSVFIAVIVAQLMDVEKIVGAFVAGLAVNNVVGQGLVKEKVIFVGNLLFIPIFFVYLGLFINLPHFFNNFFTLQLTILVVIALVVSKFIAALLAKLLYRYNWQEMLTMWSLSVPQVGVTLAVTLVAHRNHLLSVTVLNSIIVLMLVTSTLGPLITNRLALNLIPPLVKEQQPTTKLFNDFEQTDNNPFTIIVPVYNPHTQQYLIEIAALLARQANGRIVPLAIATAAAHMDAPQQEASVQLSTRLLAKATALSRLLNVKAEPLLRIDDAFAPAISRAAREQQANLIIMGWGKRTGLKARLFGNVIDSVLWAAHCPVAVTRLVESPKKIQRILVPLENVMAPSLQPVQFAQMLAEANQAQLTVLNVCDRRTSSSKIAWRRSQLSLLISKLGLANPPEVQIIAHENAAQAILQAARLYDLVVLPFVRNRTSPGGLAISDVTTQLANQLTCSIVMLGEPQRHQPTILLSGVPNPTAAV